MPTTFERADLQREQSFLEKSLQEAESPIGAALWQNRLAAVTAKLAALHEHPNTQASLALVFGGDAVVGTREIRADFAARALENFQGLVGVMFADTVGQGITQRGPIPFVEQSRLYVREMVRGSVGFLLEEKEDNQTSFVDSPLKSVVEKTIQVLDRLSSLSFEGDPLDGLNPRTVQCAHKFAETLVKSRSTAKLFANESELQLPDERVQLLYQRLDEARVTEEVKEMPGILLGLLPESGRFEFRPEGTQETMTGSASTDIQFRYISDRDFHEKYVMQPVLVKFRIVQLDRAGRVQKREFVLEDISLPPKSLTLG
jgi:hypothetical protein